MSYIHPGARASYIHWWEQQTRLVWWYKDRQHLFGYRREIELLYPHLAVPRKKRRRYRSSWRTRRIRPWDISTSGESSFVQSGYAKKEVSDEEQTRRDWRKKKGFRRDHSKHSGYRGYNAGPYGKRIVHHKRRQHERECMNKGRFDEISNGVQDVVRCWWD